MTLDKRQRHTAPASPPLLLTAATFVNLMLPIQRLITENLTGRIRTRVLNRSTQELPTSVICTSILHMHGVSEHIQ